MTRVLCLTSMYPPHHEGGYEVSCQDVMVRLVQRGHEVTVLCGDRRFKGVRDLDNERLGPLAVRRDLHLYIDDTGLLSPPWRDRWRIERANQQALRQALEASKPDVVAIWHVGALSLGLVTALIEHRLPLVYGISDDWLTYARVLDPWCRLFLPFPWMGRWLRPVLRVPAAVPDIGRSGTFCFISESTRQRAEAMSGWRFPDSTVVFSGIDGELFRRPVRQDDRPWEWRLLYVGRFDRRKGIEAVIRALAHMPPAAVLEVQGTGSEAEQQRLEHLAAELGVRDRVAFERVPRSQLPGRYVAADVCVFPSEWEEPFGLVPVEAMACGTPVAATCVGGSKEFLRDGVNCVRFRPADPADLAAAVRRLAGDAALRSSLVANGYLTAEALDVERLTDAFEARHAAAAERFANGRPPHRRLPLPPSPAEPPPWSDRPQLLPQSSGPVLHIGAGCLSNGGPAPNPTMANQWLVVHVDPDGRRGDGVTVVADPARLPFRQGVFAAALCDSVLDRSLSPQSVVLELLRVSRPTGAAVLAEPNRYRLTNLRAVVLSGGRRPVAGWTARQVEQVVLAAGVRFRRRPVSWQGQTRLRRGFAGFAPFPPFRLFSPVIVLELSDVGSSSCR